MLNKAFEIIISKIEEPLLRQGYQKQKVTGTDSAEKAALYLGEGTAYTVQYDSEKSHMLLKSCDMTEDGPDNNWRTNATWMFDPLSDGTKQAESIGNDFAEIVTSPTALKKARQPKKKKQEGEGNADPLFLAKRFITFIPKLREDITYEVDGYYPFRGVTFAQEKILPQLNSFLLTATKGEVDKLSQMLSTQYQNGDADTRAIITFVLLNNIDDRFADALRANMSDGLKKAWEASNKFKGKQFKPATRKAKKKPGMMERLQEQQQTR
ncbi:MAG: hypothetical protein LBM65_02050 [Oscillospiraceae bacterium]|jgi:hypothetical protein|nr:hypothetical protein [Oscillospiraceae bacterium]